jgi:hypothetical protein
MGGTNSPDGALATRECAELDLTVPTYRGCPCDPLHLKTQGENDTARILHTVRISTEYAGAEPQASRLGDGHPRCGDVGGVGALAGIGPRRAAGWTAQPTVDW